MGLWETWKPPYLRRPPWGDLMAGPLATDWEEWGTCPKTLGFRGQSGTSERLANSEKVEGISRPL